MRAYDGTMAIAAIVWHELLYGLARLPEGTRKRRLSAGIYHVIAPAFPVLPYTSARGQSLRSSDADSLYSMW